MGSEYMTRINRYCQINKLKVDCDTIDVKGPSHVPEFTVVIKINDKKYGTGTGKSKKEAKAVAAKETWEMIEEQQKSLSNMAAADLTTTQSTSPPALDKDYVSLLNTFSQKMREIVDYSDKSCTGDAHAPMFSISCTISGHLYGRGTGPSLAAAKQAAAKEAYEKLENERSNGSCTLSKYSNVSQGPTESDMVENMKDMAVCEKPSPLQRNAESSSLKPKRKLAANFAIVRNREEKEKVSDSSASLPDVDRNTGQKNGSPHTVNKTFLDLFEKIEPIGKGGFGNVFKATSKSDKKTYAIKRVELTEKVEREAVGLARLTHENIVRYYCSWKGDDHMKYPDSSWLNLILKSEGKLGGSKNAVVQRISSHQPQNIFISHDDKIKIGDFGLVTSVAFETLTEDRGTKSYMAPEQSGARYGKEVDIYALGLIWFEILSACTYHEKTKVWPSVRKGELSKDFTDKFPSEVPIIKNMLSTQPSARMTISYLLDLVKSVDKEKVLRNNSY